MLEVLLIIVSIIAYFYIRQKKIFERVDQVFHGPKPTFLLGNSLELAGTTEEMYMKIQDWSKRYTRFFRMWLGTKLFIVMYDHKDLEVVLTSNTHINKNQNYDFLVPWIGFGLLTSTGSRWKKHRKIITPTFHFKILEDFIEVFNKNASIMCDKLAEHTGQETFNVYTYVNLAALDNICETAMGIEIKAQDDSDSKYVRSIKDLLHIVIQRSFKVWLSFDFIFNMTKYKKMQKEALATVHGMTYNVIKNRKLAMEQQPEDNESKCTDQKKRLAFLDLLLEVSQSSNLTDQDIREEVDTFMFEGHDTISSGTSFALYALSQHPDIQEKCYLEQQEIFGDSGRQSEMKDLQNMKYLEMVIKEAQRLYPTVPYIGRSMHEDLTLSDGVVIPKGTQLILMTTATHKDPSVWTNPEKFDPNNFALETSVSRNAFSYVPFSAGPRNCIGQRFAMLEMKSTISSVLRRYKLSSCEQDKKVRLVAEAVLISANGVNIKLDTR